MNLHRACSSCPDMDFTACGPGPAAPFKIARRLIRAWCSQKHAHIQFNILSKQSLLEAQKNPEKYRDLEVRIAGYCAYFMDLTPPQQAEIIARTEESMG